MRNLKILAFLTLSGLIAFGFVPDSASALEPSIEIGSAKSSEPTNPAPFFRPILQQLRTYSLPLRLPSSVGDNMSGLVPEVYAGTGYLAVNFTEPLPCYFCHLGRIYVSQPNATSREWLESNQRNGAGVTLKEGVRGFYSRGMMAPSGYRPTLVWEQDGFIYGVSFYAGEDLEPVRQFLIDMARSMVSQQPVTGR